MKISKLTIYSLFQNIKHNFLSLFFPVPTTMFIPQTFALNSAFLPIAWPWKNYCFVVWKLNSWIDVNFKIFSQTGLINNPSFVFYCHVRKTLINSKKCNPLWIIMLMQASENGDLILIINYGDEGENFRFLHIQK